MYNDFPNHVGVIMDGNGRWASDKGYPRIYGHKQGIHNIERLIDISASIGIKILTLYAFSTENWKRPRNEIDYIFSLPRIYKSRLMKVFHRNNVQVKWIGTKKKLDTATINLINSIQNDTKNNSGLNINLAFNYGGRNEIVEIIKSISIQCKENKIKINDINEETLAKYFSTPDLDLLIRTGGVQRVSNFLLWQLSYSEIIFVNKMWPDFTEEDFMQCINFYRSTAIRKGGITS